MKIKQKPMAYKDVIAIPQEKHIRPVKPNMFFRTLLRTLSVPELKSVGFECRRHGMEKLGKDEPALFLMNHSCFIDLKIAAAELYPRPFNIVCTSDGFVGKDKLMRALGCIPTKKFIQDSALVRDMLYTVKELRSSILMYPEASYSFDGTATPLPESLGKCIKLLKVPVVMIRTSGAFGRDPLYNMLQLRKVKVSADMSYLLSKEDIASMSAEEINAILREQFRFDGFREQREKEVRIDEPFRADGLNRVLYKCPHCKTEGEMSGKGIHIECRHCGKKWELTELGALKATDGETEYDHVPDWYAWERDEVRRELEEGKYKLDIPVDIGMLVDSQSLYMVGEGRLVHDKNGFVLTGCDGELSYTHTPAQSYSLYSDYYWYEIGDMICIGDSRALYYCFPKEGGDVVAKTRLAAEELYKLNKAKKS